MCLQSSCFVEMAAKKRYFGQTRSAHIFLSPLIGRNSNNGIQSHTNEGATYSESLKYRAPHHQSMSPTEPRNLLSRRKLTQFPNFMEIERQAASDNIIRIVYRLFESSIVYLLQNIAIYDAVLDYENILHLSGVSNEKSF